jgi:hypothetical protein
MRAAWRGRACEPGAAPPACGRGLKRAEGCSAAIPCFARPAKRLARRGWAAAVLSRRRASAPAGARRHLCRAAAAPPGPQLKPENAASLSCASWRSPFGGGAGVDRWEIWGTQAPAWAGGGGIKICACVPWPSLPPAPLTNRRRAARLPPRAGWVRGLRSAPARRGSACCDPLCAAGAQSAGRWSWARRGTWRRAGHRGQGGAGREKRARELRGAQRSARGTAWHGAARHGAAAAPRSVRPPAGAPLLPSPSPRPGLPHLSNSARAKARTPSAVLRSRSRAARRTER